MSNPWGGRWAVLALLFFVRGLLGFQFQSVATLAPLLQQAFGADISNIGFLIGIYLAPGIVVALPGGAIGQRFGDKRVVLAALLLMLAGSAVMALAASWAGQIGGRVLAGTGGVLLNVVMAKMVADWFEGQEIATAMGIFVNAWPVGIALALLVLPAAAEHHGLVFAHVLTGGLILIGAALLALLYRAPQTPAVPRGEQTALSGSVLGAVIVAGGIWGLYNASLGMIFGFAPTMLVERGWSLAAASSMTSIVLWLVAISVPLGGIIADRTGRRNGVMLISFVAFAALLVVSARIEQVTLAFIGLGLLSGLAAGPIMSLPSRVLAPAQRSMGMGVYYTLQYIVVVAAPWLGGLLATRFGGAAVTFDFGAVMLMCCVAALGAFHILARPGIEVAEARSRK